MILSDSNHERHYDLLAEQEEDRTPDPHLISVQSERRLDGQTWYTSTCSCGYTSGRCATPGRAQKPGREHQLAKQEQQ